MNTLTTDRRIFAFILYNICDGHTFGFSLCSSILRHTNLIINSRSYCDDEEGGGSVVLEIEIAAGHSSHTNFHNS